MGALRVSPRPPKSRPRAGLLTDRPRRGDPCHSARSGDPMPSEQPLAGRCGARTRNGGYCTQWPVGGAGAGRCKVHGGLAPQVRAAQERRAEERRIEGALAKLLDQAKPDYQHPIEGLLEVVSRTGAMMTMLGDLVGRLEAEPLGETELLASEDGDIISRITPTLYGPDHNGDGAPHVLVGLYGVWTDRHVKACKTAIDAGLDERTVRLAERQGEMIHRVLSGVLDELGVGDRPEVPQIVARHLRAVS